MSDLKALARDLRAAARDVVEASNRAGETTAKVVMKSAVRQSSGTVKASQFRQVTGDPHPFALRHGHALLPREILNKQSGLLARSWQVMRIRTANGQIIYVVRNVAPYAKFLETGTRTMFSRPVDWAVEFENRGVFEKFFAVELTTLLTRRFRG